MICLTLQNKEIGLRRPRHFDVRSTDSLHFYGGTQGDRSYSPSSPQSPRIEDFAIHRGHRNTLSRSQSHEKDHRPTVLSPSTAISDRGRENVLHSHPRPRSLSTSFSFHSRSSTGPRHSTTVAIPPRPSIHVEDRGRSRSKGRHQRSCSTSRNHETRSHSKGRSHSRHSIVVVIQPSTMLAEDRGRSKSIGRRGSSHSRSRNRDAFSYSRSRSHSRHSINIPTLSKISEGPAESGVNIYQSRPLSRYVSHGGSRSRSGKLAGVHIPDTYPHRRFPSHSHSSVHSRAHHPVTIEISPEVSGSSVDGKMIYQPHPPPVISVRETSRPRRRTPSYTSSSGSSLDRYVDRRRPSLPHPRDVLVQEKNRRRRPSPSYTSSSDSSVDRSCDMSLGPRPLSQSRHPEVVIPPQKFGGTAEGVVIGPQSQPLPRYEHHHYYPRSHSPQTTPEPPIVQQPLYPIPRSVPKGSEDKENSVDGSQTTIPLPSSSRVIIQGDKESFIDGRHKNKGVTIIPCLSCRRLVCHS